MIYVELDLLRTNKLVLSIQLKKASNESATFLGNAKKILPLYTLKARNEIRKKHT